MKTCLILPLCIFLCAKQVFAQQTFIKKFDSLFFSTDLIATSDHGFALAGYGAGTRQGSQRIFKLDSAFNLQWGNQLDGSSQNGSILQLKDKGFMVFGSRQGEVTQENYLLVTRYSASGTLMWSKQYLTEKEIDFVRKATALSDSTFVVVSNSNNYDYPFIVTVIDINGNVLSNKSITLEGGTQRVHAVVKIDSNSFVITGNTNLRNRSKGFVMRLTITGGILWAKKLGSSLLTEANAIIKDGNNLFITGGVDSSILLTKIDINGNVLASGSIGGAGYDYAHSIIKTSDGNILLAGKTNSFGSRGDDVYLVKLKKNGQVLWSATTHPDNTFEINSLFETDKHNYLINLNNYQTSITGEQNYIIQATQDGGLCNKTGTGAVVTPVRLNMVNMGVQAADGVSVSAGPVTISNTYFDYSTECADENLQAISKNTTGSDLKLNSPSLKIFPNPVQNSTLYITLNNLKESATMIITDAQGKRVMTKSVSGTKATTAVDIIALKSGIYYVSIQSGMIRLAGKFIKPD